MGDNIMISFPPNPSIGTNHTINGAIYVYDGNSWNSQNGTVVIPASGAGEDLSAYKYGDLLFNVVGNTTGNGLKINGWYWDVVAGTLGYSPSTKQINRTYTNYYQDVSGLNKLVGFNPLNDIS